MSNDAKKWSQAAAKLRRALGLAPPTFEEADAEVAEAQAAPMTNDDIKTIVDAATGEAPVKSPDPQPDYGWTGEFATDDVADEMLVLNREGGEEDPEVDDRVEKHRKEELEDDDEENGQT